MRSQPDVSVVEWLDELPPVSIWITSITVLEVRTGLEFLVASRRRKRIELAFGQLLREDLDGRVLSFDIAAAEIAGTLVARQKQAGKSMEIRDAQIAGITLARKATLATGNTRHFKDIGIKLIDPWNRTAS